MRRFLEGRLSPRSLVWTYLTSIVAASVAVFVLLFTLLVRYLPHEYLEKAGLECVSEAACGTTLPIWVDASFSFLLGGVLLGLVAFAVYAVAGQVSASRRHADDLDLAARFVLRSVPDRLRGRVLVTDDPVPRSYTMGFLRPRVVLSSGLYEALDETELEAVLAHEEGHLVARDNLIGLVGRTLAMTFVLVPGVRFAYGRLQRAQELAADEYARESTGDGLIVAASLHKFVSSFVRVSSLGYGFAEDAHVGERIRGLLAEPAVRCSRRLCVMVVLTIALLFSGFSASALAFTGVRLAGSGDPACHLSVGQPGGDVHEFCTAGPAAE